MKILFPHRMSSLFRRKTYSQLTTYSDWVCTSYSDLCKHTHYTLHIVHCWYIKKISIYIDNFIKKNYYYYITYCKWRFYYTCLVVKIHLLIIRFSCINSKIWKKFQEVRRTIKSCKFRPSGEISLLSRWRFLKTLFEINFSGSPFRFPCTIVSKHLQIKDFITFSNGMILFLKHFSNA